MKSTLVTWRDSIARLGALRQLHSSISALHDYPVLSKEKMLDALLRVIQEEEKVAADLEWKLSLELQSKRDGLTSVRDPLD